MWCHPFGLLDRLKLPGLLHSLESWGVEEEAVEYSDWQRFERVFSDGRTEERYIQEIIFGRRLQWRYGH